MPQFISTNVTAIIARNNLDSSSNSLSTSIERLSSGQRINSSKDDAAGMAIASRMTSQIEGMEMAQRNTQDAISMTQTTEGALGTQVSQLQRIRELAVQASNGILGVGDRAKLDNEAQALLDEIDRIATTSSFNGNLLLSHKNKIANNSITTIGVNDFFDTAKTLTNLTAGTMPSWATVSGSNIVLDTNAISSADIGTVFSVGVSAYSNATAPILGTGTTAVASSAALSIAQDSNISPVDALELDRFQLLNGSFNSTQLNITDIKFTSGNGTNPATIEFVPNPSNIGDVATFDIHDTNTGETHRMSLQVTDNIGGFTVFHSGSMGDIGDVETMTRNYQIQSTGDRDAAGNNMFEIVDSTNPNTLNFQVGADNGQNRTVRFKSTTTVDMGLIDSTQSMVRVSLATTNDAMNTIDRIDAALKYINDERSNMGAYQNRLTQTISNLNAGIENTSASRSRISDTDFAKETANMTKNQILHQAGIAMLKQANSLPESVLSLLG